MKHHIIPLDNNEKNENHRIRFENIKKTNYGNHRISCENNENHEKSHSST